MDRGGFTCRSKNPRAISISLKWVIFLFSFALLMLMRDVGKLYSKRWKQKTLVVNGSLDSVSRLTLVALSLYTTTHSLPPSSPNVYYHFNQLSHCSPRLKTSEDEEGNCWLSSECNLRFSCILCDAINSPSLPRSLSSLLFFFLFSVIETSIRRRRWKKMVRKSDKKKFCLSFVYGIPNPLNLIVVSRGLCHQSCKKKTKTK